MSLKKYEALIVQSWDIQKVSQLLMEKVPFEELIFDKTDILLEAVLRNEFILFKRILTRGFPIKKSNFNYLIPILYNYIEDKKKYLDILFQYVEPKEYINKQGGLNKETALSIVAQQQNQGMIILLSKLGGDWNAVNSLQQTPFHFLLRNHMHFSIELLEELRNNTINLEKEDDFGINAIDIIDNLVLVPEWAKENQQLLKVIGYENRK